MSNIYREYRTRFEWKHIYYEIDSSHTDIEDDRKDRNLHKKCLRSTIDMWKYTHQSPRVEDIPECCRKKSYHRKEYRWCSTIEWEVPNHKICKEKNNNTNKETCYQCDDTNKEKSYTIHFWWTKDFFCTDGNIIESWAFHRKYSNRRCKPHL